MQSPAEIVRACFAAYERKDRAAIEALLAPDFTFSSPLDDNISRERYFERCWPNSEHLGSFQIQKLFVQGDEAFVKYQAQPTDGRPPFRNTEFFTVRGGQVVHVDVYFGTDTNAPNAEADKQKIRDVIAAWIRASVEGDVERVLGLMAEDVVFLLPGQQPMRGRDAFAAASRSADEKPQLVEAKPSIQDIEIAGDYAFCWNYLSLTLSLPDGTAARRAGHILSIFRREPDGRWVLFRDANMLTAV